MELGKQLGQAELAAAPLPRRGSPYRQIAVVDRRIAPVAKGDPGTSLVVANLVVQLVDREKETISDRQNRIAWL